MKALVTGGGGFLGTRIVEMLHERQVDVVALGRRNYPHLSALGICTVEADIRDADALRDALRGVDVVFHAAAVPGIWGRRDDFWDINAGGTANVLAGCRANGVPRLVYTSSPSVIFGNEDLRGVDESHPYPAKHLADYPKTKAVAERMILKANKPGLATVSLRPHLIWGPRDPHLLPRVIDRARRGRLRRVGRGDNLVDITYIDNAAEAHLLAANALLEVDAACAGKAYFISQGEPVNLWQWINDLLVKVDVAPVTRGVSYGAASTIGALMEWVYRAGKLQAEPPMTRFLASQLAMSHYFSIEAARRDLQYEPAISTQVGLERTAAWLRGELPGPLHSHSVSGGSALLPVNQD